MVRFPKIQFVCYRTNSQNNFMVLFSAFRSVSLVLLASLSTSAALLLTAPARAQTPAIDDTQPNPSNEDLRPLAQDGTLLSINGGQRLMDEASSAASSQSYDVAVKKLQEARELFNQLSNFYQDLAASFSGIDPRIADVQRQQAFQSAQMRDQATYQLALVHRAQNQPELAVPLLVQIIRSQNPTRDLGQRAYQQLYELGFVTAPFPRNAGAGSTSATPQPTAPQPTPQPSGSNQQ